MKNNGIRNLFEPKICKVSYSKSIIIILICEILIHKIRNIEIINADFLPPMKILIIIQRIPIIKREKSDGKSRSSSGISFMLSANKSNNGNNANKKTWIGQEEIRISSVFH